MSELILSITQTAFIISMVTLFIIKSINADSINNFLQFIVLVLFASSAITLIVGTLILVWI